MKRTITLVVLAILVMACGEDTFPPQACGTVDDQEVFVGQSETIVLCYTDPDGDEVTVTATASDPSVVEVVVQGRARAIALKGKGVGQSAVTVAAKDSRGLEAPEQVFNVSVPNREPVAEELPEVTLTDEAPEARLTLTEYFSDPDGHALEFAATVSDERVIRATVTDAVLEIEAVGGGEATVRVRATDTHGASVSANVQVAIRVTVEILNDDYTVLSDSWSPRNAETEIVLGRLKLTPVVKTSEAILRHAVDPATDWSVDVNLEYVSDRLWPAIMIESDGDPSIIMILIGGRVRELYERSDLPETNLVIAMFSESQGGWVSGHDKVGLYPQIAAGGAAIDIGVRLGPETLSVLVNGTTIHTAPRHDPVFNLTMSETIRAFTIGAYPSPVGGIVAMEHTWFDHVLVTGILTGGASSAENKLNASRLPRMSGTWRIYR